MENVRSDRTWIVVFVACFLGLMVDGYDLIMLSITMPSLMEEFNIGIVSAGLIATWSLVGMGVGGIIGGWLADRYGRVRMATWMMVLFSVGTCLLGFAQTYEQFIAIRFISAIGIGAEYTIATMLMAEYVPTKRRTTVLGTIQAAYSLGYLVAALLAGAILPEYGWRPLYIIAVIPVLLAIYIRFRVPEPQGWKERVQAQKQKGNKKNEWVTIFKDSKTRRTFIFWGLTATFLQFAYYGVGTWLPTYIVADLGFDFKNMTWYLVGTYTAAILGKIIAGWLADRYGRKTMFVFGGLSTAILLPVVYLYNSPTNIIALLTLLGFLYGIPYAVNATYMHESFPAHIRGTAVGGSYNIGRVGSAMAPFVIGVIAESYSIGLGLATLGIAYVLSAVIPGLFIREKMYDPAAKEENAVTEQGESAIKTKTM